MKLWINGILVVLVFQLLLSCSAGEDPVGAPTEKVPDLTDGIRQASDTQSQTNLWGYYDFYFDLDEMTVDAVPNRTSDYSTNIVQFLNMNPMGVGVSFNGTTPGSGYIDIDLDVTITHPLDNAKFDGYDVRGVFLGNGNATMQHDSDLIFPIIGFDQQLLNADGMTRWFNPVEFSTPGIFGYTDGLVASKDYDPTATLNPYKYFGEGLGVDHDFWTYLVSGNPNLGYFLHGTSNTRNYLIRFPIPSPGVKYGYAIIANWEGGDSSDHPSHAREAVGCRVIDTSNAWFKSVGDFGGEIRLDIYLSDWYADSVSTISVESPVLSSNYSFDPSTVTPFNGGQNYSAWHVDIPVDFIDSNNPVDLFVIAEYSAYDYKNPFGVPNTVEAPLTAFFRHSLNIKDEEPPFIYLEFPAGGETFYTGFSELIEWEATLPPGDTIDISYSKDGFVQDINTIVSGTENDGEFLWQDIPDDPSDTVKVRIASHDQPWEYHQCFYNITIATPSITLISPNGQETWIAGDSQDITWSSIGVSGTVRLEYSTDLFIDDINLIADSTENDGIHEWDPIPNIDSNTVLVRVMSDVSGDYDDCDQLFTISQPWIDVTSPDGGENWESFTSEEITWDSEGIPGNVDITFSTDGFQGVNDITVVSGTENDGSYTWPSLPCVVSNSCEIRVSSVDIPSAFGTSDSTFTITPADIGWVRTADDSGDISRVTEVEAVTEAAIYATGFFTDGNNDYYAYLSKHNSCSELWRREIHANAPGDEVFSYGVAVDGNNYVYIAGYFTGTVDFNPFGGNEHTSNGDTDCFIAKYDENGEFLNALVWGGEGMDSVQDISADTGGGIYATGYFSGTDVDFDPGPGEELHSSNGQVDVFFVKFNVVGMFNYAYTWGGSNDDFGYGIKTDGASVYVCGVYQNQVDFDPSGVIEFYTSEGGTDCFTSRYTAPGTYMWSMVWGGAAGDDFARAVAIDATSNVRIVGNFWGTVDFSPHEWETVNLTSNGSSDAFLSMISSAGVFESAFTWGGGGDDYSSGIDVDPAGSILVCGQADGAVDFNPEGGAVLEAFGVYLTKLSDTGLWEWSRAVTGGLSSDGLDIDTDNSGNIYTAGYFAGTVDFAPTLAPCDTPSDEHNSDGNQDSFLMKHLSDGCWY